MNFFHQKAAFYTKNEGSQPAALAKFIESTKIT